MPSASRIEIIQPFARLRPILLPLLDMPDAAAARRHGHCFCCLAGRPACSPVELAHPTPSTIAADPDDTESHPRLLLAEPQNNLSTMIKEKQGQTWSSIKTSLGLLEDPFDPPEDTQVITSTERYPRSIISDEEMVIITCSRCSKPLVIPAFARHAEHCSGDTLMPETAAAVLMPSATETAKIPGTARSKVSKRKADDLDGGHDKSGERSGDKSEQTPPKLTKLQIKSKTPLNLDVQCGVPIDGNSRCLRSISCKIHSVSLKRAVQRSLPYDQLYFIHINRQKGTSFTDPSKAAGSASATGAATGSEVMSMEQESAAVFNALRRNHALPLATPNSYSYIQGWKAFQRRLSLIALIKAPSVGSSTSASPATFGK
ncbi:uncharacterized protein BJ171DRAFT_564397 [Polychytrium aggregatum]|uniref:uncharacterized protein n=1 Tax=Polychytrium aggregatum TaxID=110093 RepID=UPI0022FE477C|nr:uncharacterized protein BJ171DRAFT_564397 [Polychytrium aggregatum]KAI9209912.1 hypothetical protein BJ171DRAFT_564397 [Polychytrium aggregatum]